jgi:hypothetical protein
MAEVRFSELGWVAHYDSRETRVRKVVGWDDDGLALVVDEGAGSRRPAARIPGSSHLERVPRVAAAVPTAPGWLWRWNDAPAETYDAEVAVWLVTDEGRVYPVCGSNDPFLVADDDGELMSPQWQRMHGGDMLGGTLG